MDKWTNGQTDKRTDGVTLSLLELLMAAKNEEVDYLRNFFLISNITDKKYAILELQQLAIPYLSCALKIHNFLQGYLEVGAKLKQELVLATSLDHTNTNLANSFAIWACKQHPQMVFALAMHRSHKNFSFFTHIEFKHFFSDSKIENQNCRKIGPAARKIKRLIMTNFFLNKIDVKNF